MNRFIKIINNNEPVSSFTHFLGFLLSVVALVLLVITAVQFGTAWHVVAFSIFGASLILLYAASTVYHFMPRYSAWKKFWQRIDLSLIFVLIAGTYTPIALLPLHGPWGWVLFGMAWGIAIIGLSLHILKVNLNSAWALFLYLAMGWMVVLIMPILWQNLSLAGLAWLLAGGIFYTIGVIFFGLGRFKTLSRWFGFHDIFHIFVLAGSFSHFWLMYKFVVYIN